MSDDGAYKQLLTTASRTHQQQHAASAERLVGGNVFLPAIARRSGAQSALSLKHLEVIEQCILAENRREEQLARCASEKERRYLTKKFQLQRDHERDLIDALMLGHPSERELQIIDVQASKAAYTSPLRSTGQTASPTRGHDGVRMTHVTPDKVLTMAGDRTFATTTSGKAPRSRSPTRVATQHPGDDATVTMSSLSPSKKSAGAIGKSPVRTRPSLSASPTRKSPKRSVSGSTDVDLDMKLPRALHDSPLKPTRRAEPSPHQHHHHGATKSPSKQRPKPTRHRAAGERGGDAANPFALAIATQCETETVDAVTETEAETFVFEGVTSFLEARQLAIAALHEHKGLVDGGTQTTYRGDDDDAVGGAASSPKRAAPLSTHEDPLAPHASSRSSLELVRELAGSIQAVEASHSPGKALRHPSRRPYSSPEARRRHSLDAPLPSVAHTLSGKALPGIDCFRADELVLLDGNKSHLIDDQVNTSHALANASEPPLPVKEVAWGDSVVEPVAAKEQVIDPSVLESTHTTESRSVDEDDEGNGETVDSQQNMTDLLTDHNVPASELHHGSINVAEVPSPRDCWTREGSSDDHAAFDGGDEVMESVTGMEGSTSREWFSGASSAAELSDEVTNAVYELVELVVEDVSEDDGVYWGTHHEQLELEKAVSAIEIPEAASESPRQTERTLLALGFIITRIQSAFRGHRARRAFHLALYQEALQCGVLGAMPGTQQGKSGWYQDPKSLVAFNFVVQDDGEWTQKAAVPCTALILSPYEMHAQIQRLVELSPRPPASDEQHDGNEAIFF